MTIDILLLANDSTLDCLEQSAAPLQTQAAAHPLRIVVAHNGLRSDANQKAGALGAHTQCVTAQGTQQPGALLNKAIRLCTAPWVLVLQAGAVCAPDFWAAAQAGIQKHPTAAGFMCRQLPLEPGQHIDPVSLETTLLFSAAVLLQREAFFAAGGFDPHLPGLSAWADLTWRLAAQGPVLYLPGAVATTTQPQEPDTLEAYVNEHLGRLLLHYKYKNTPSVWRGNVAYRRVIKNPKHYPGVRKALLLRYVRHFFTLWPLLFWRLRHPAAAGISLTLEEGFAPQRGRAPLPQRLAEGPLISVIVRTHKRPGRLRRALQSLAHQTYTQFEIIVVEDGEPTSQTMVQTEFAHLPLRYTATGQNIGRSRAGNLGLGMAKGSYLNFLDDDDYFYPDHLELVAERALKHPEADMILCNSAALIANIHSEEPFAQQIQAFEPINIDRLDAFTMCQHCQLSIESVLFKKTLFEQCGGLDEKLDANEDWAMWLRFLAVARRIHPTSVDIPRATTLFTQPAGAQQAQQRLALYKENDKAFFGDESIRFDVSLADMRNFYSGVLADIRHVQAKGELDAFLQREAQWEEDGQP